MNIILASASERRHELLKRITKDFKIIVSDFDENSIEFEGNFEEYVKSLSKGKATSVANKCIDDAIIIGCDTIVAFNGEVLGKPKDENEAFNMLEKLSGGIHKVYSGITLIRKCDNKIFEESVCTEVKFSNITKDDIRAYIKTGEPFDKAGAYGIQGYGGLFVEEIKGCYYNIVGLPINKLNYMLKQAII
ncbi:Maf-like protein [Clostridium algidicarnis]|uniref:Maf-like protein n=1 Tax=Clostridium algidicarnis TaxID=37659 RepID=UPI001625A9B5|nr:Maf-like protein [Clostridium algidicarnis]MBB6697439.1 Maf-like protein [Clostridium algidicarnis]